MRAIDRNGTNFGILHKHMSESDTSRHFLRQWIEKDVADGKTGGKVDRKSVV